MAVTIYHNPRCSKSRQTLKLLEDRGIAPVIVEYLKSPPEAAVLSEILTQLGMAPRDLLRKQEPPYKALGLAQPSVSDQAIIEAMVENPILMERPIVVADGKAAVGRPPEAVLAILDS